LLDGRSGFTLLHGGGGGGGGFSGGGVGDGSGGHVKILAGNITEKADFGGMLNLQSGKGPLGSGRAFMSTMDRLLLPFLFFILCGVAFSMLVWLCILPLFPQT
jgi:hypothetical protein